MSLSTIKKKFECCITLLLWRMYVASNKKAYLGLHVKGPIFLFDFNEIFNLPADFHKRPSMSNFTEIRPVGVALIHADGHDGANCCFSRLCHCA